MLRICKSGMQLLLKYLITHLDNCDASGSRIKWSCGHIWDLNWLVKTCCLFWLKKRIKFLDWKLMFWRALTTFCFFQTSTSLVSAGTWILSTACCKTSVDHESKDQVQEKLLLPVPNVFRRKTWGGLITVRFLELFPKSSMHVIQSHCRRHFSKKLSSLVSLIKIEKPSWDSCYNMLI